MITVILGGAVCVWDDLKRFRTMYDGEIMTIATNETGWMYQGKLDHWISLHPENFERKNWLLRRPQKDYLTWSHRWKVDRILQHWGAGSSGLYAATLAKHLCSRRNVFCGVPMDERGNVDGRKNWADKEVRIHREGWLKHLDDIKEDFRSMSGWTMELLGEPTEEWLSGDI